MKIYRTIADRVILDPGQLSMLDGLEVSAIAYLFRPHNGDVSKDVSLSFSVCAYTGTCILFIDSLQWCL